ncbi:MAG: 2-oxoacid:acceptor oxidoreductase family protein [Fibrobacterota bacterium]
MTNILFCGVGGQGVLTASEIAGMAAMLAGYRVKKSEVHGMSQRGGSVDSHLRFGKTVHSPLIKPGEADFLVPFNAEEGVPLRVFLKKDGLDLSLFLEKAIASVPDKKFVNTYMLGVLSAFLPIPAETWLLALTRQIKRAPEENRAVFLQGANEGKQYDIQRKN